MALVQLPDFRSRSQDNATQHTLLSILEALCGLAQSTRSDSAQEFFSLVLPLLQTTVSLLELYADVPEVVRVILELFCLVAENYTIFLDEVKLPWPLKRIIFSNPSFPCILLIMKIL